MNLKCTWNTGQELLGNSSVAGRCWVKRCSRMLCLDGSKTAGIMPCLQSYQRRKGLSWCFWCCIMLKPAWLINPRVKHSWQKGEAVPDLVGYQIKQQTSGTANLSKDAKVTQLVWKHRAHSHFLMSGQVLQQSPFWRFLPWVEICLKVTPQSWEKAISPQSLVSVSKINLYFIISFVPLLQYCFKNSGLN